MVETAAGTAGAFLAGKAAEAAWKRFRKSDPPQTPGARGVKWRTALAWAAVTGMTVAVAQLAARGAASAAWTKATGRKPPRKRRLGI
jgi:hypothetical protein